MWRFNSIVVLVFIWLGDGSRFNKSCLHDLGVPNHHCYRVSSQLLVKFISFWYQSFGSKISLTIFYFRSISCFLLQKKKKKKKKKREKKKEKKRRFLSTRRGKFLNHIIFQYIISSKKISSFQSCFSPYSSS